jgi:hypothetical protein
VVSMQQGMGVDDAGAPPHQRPSCHRILKAA